MEKTFSHLRVSSEYSITQGLLTIDQIVESASKNSIPSVALTDKSNMFGLVKFFSKCEAAGIKPISGASIRLIFDNDESSYELLCLAKTNQGHKNLMKVISNAHNNHSFNSPVISFNELVELKNDILVISGGKDSHIFEYLKRNNISDTNKVIDQFTKYFKDDFILEVQRTNRPDEAEYFKNVLPLAINRGIPLVATNDVLFANQDDYEVHETKVCINTSKTLNDPNRERKFSNEQFFKSQKEMSDLFADHEDFLSNTSEIAKQCNVSFTPKGYFLPEYPVPKEHDFNSYLKDLSFKNLESLIHGFDKSKKTVSYTHLTLPTILLV